MRERKMEERWERSNEKMEETKQVKDEMEERREELWRMKERTEGGRKERREGKEVEKNEGEGKGKKGGRVMATRFPLSLSSLSSSFTASARWHTRVSHHYLRHITGPGEHERRFP